MLIYGAMVLTIGPMELQFESYTTIYIYVYINIYQEEFREAMTPEEKQKVKLQHAQAKTQRITILIADKKARRNLQHSRGQENFREPMTPEVKQEVKKRYALAKTQRMTQETSQQK